MEKKSKSKKACFFFRNPSLAGGRALKGVSPALRKMEKKPRFFFHFLSHWISAKFHSIIFLKNTKNIYALWYVQKSYLCYLVSRLGAPLAPLNLKINLEKSKTVQKVINFRFPLEFHCKLCMSALRNCTQIFRNALRNVPRVIRVATDIVWRGLWAISSLNTPEYQFCALGSELIELAL